MCFSFIDAIGHARRGLLAGGGCAADRGRRAAATRAPAWRTAVVSHAHGGRAVQGLRALCAVAALFGMTPAGEAEVLTTQSMALEGQGRMSAAALRPMPAGPHAAHEAQTQEPTSDRDGDGLIDVRLRTEKLGDDESLLLSWAPVDACRLTPTPQDALLRCDRQIAVEDAGDTATQRLLWRAGFDSLLVVSSTTLGSESNVPPGSARLRATAHVEPSRSDARSRRRLTLLRAQWWHYQGRPETALELLARLDAEDPGNPDVLSFRARLELERGKSRQAEAVFRSAAALAPRRSDLVRAVEELTRQRAPSVEVERSLRDVGGIWREGTLTMTGRRELRPYLMLTGELQRTEGSVRGLRMRSGEVASPSFTQWLAEASLEQQFSSGTRLRGGLAAGRAGLGALAAVELLGAAGKTLLAGEVNRPFGEFLEGAAQAGTRDRVEATRQQTLGSRGGAWLVAARNGYRLEGDLVATSTALTLGAVYQIRRRDPSVSVQYGLDIEANVSRLLVVDGEFAFAPLNIAARQVHVGGLNVVQGVGRGFRVDLSGGYALDRLGGRGAFGQARLWTPSLRRVNADVWAEYRLHILTTAQRATRVGARVWVTF